MTKCDEKHSTNLNILQYKIILGTYFTIYLYISIRLFPLCKMNERQHDINKRTCVPSEYSISLGCPHEDNLGPKATH